MSATYMRIFPIEVLKDGKSIRVVAITKPMTECEAIEWCLSKSLFITLDKRSRQTSIESPMGTSTENERCDIPSDIFSYIPKKSRRVDDEKPGTMKLSPQITPHTR